MIRLAATLTAAVAVVAVMAAPAAAEEPVDPGSRMMLVLDSSGSMAEATPSGGTRIDAAKDALRQVIAGLPDDQEVGLRVYGAEVFSQNDPGACTDSQLIAQPETGNRDALTAALDDYEPYGETPIGYALQEAGKDLGTERPRTIVLVSDGEPTCAPDPCEVATQLAGDGVDVRIDVVGLDVDEVARDKLRCIADNGRGTYYDAKDADDLVRSLDTSTTRASRPFDLTGTPIQGTASPADAPTVTTGQYLDTVPLNDGLWYRIERTVPNSTIHVGVAHYSADLGNAGNWMSVDLYADPEAMYCGHSMTFPLGNLGYTAAMTWAGEPEDACNTADVIYVHVGEVQNIRKDLAGQPVEIAVYEEPPLADPSGRDLAAAPGEPAWTPLEAADPVTDVVPGTSISNAPVVSDGTYAFDINSGETQVVAIPLDWGQNVQAQLDGIVPEATSLGTGPTIQISGPVRQENEVDFYGSQPEDWSEQLWGTVRGGAAFRVGAQTLTVGYLNRLAPTADPRGASVPGLRYVQVSYFDAGDPMRYTLTLKTNGTAGEGAPEYAEVDGLTPPVADSALVNGDEQAADDPTGDPTSDPTSGDQNAEDQDNENQSLADGDGPPWLSIGLAVAGALALAGAAWLIRRNRAPSGSTS
ncbi:VWA domain-containing protein [Jiangella sp. DSM 45060]|uniref:vWA domain-containing protein n=1 Tax=Jiangella sp. DSM 45060 TaxID=1798224 RepID=UPI00087DDE30|nr:VWA domain-containing protein [Jiangella sp. DSM 45060]SDT02884.1 Ca-activated chloride channel family protein [Jiangella sp. DSM 45060]